MPPGVLKKIFAEKAKDADIAVIEGVMGLYDGGKEQIGSTAQIAKLLDAPVVLVIDAKAMGASAAALALGFKQYDAGTTIAGVILNRLGSATHEETVREAMDALAVPVFGALHRDENLILPERHLGLVPEGENAAAESVVQNIKAVVEQAVDVNMLVAVAEAASTMLFEENKPFVSRDYGNIAIAVAQDEAFNFYYPESLAVLSAKTGVTLIPFSPLKDETLPEADGMILGGGFPEMFAAALSANEPMRRAVKDAAAKGMPIYAECGGYMYLFDKIVDFAGNEYSMVGVINGAVTMEKKLRTVGYVKGAMRKETILGPKGTVLLGHEFHFSAAPQIEEKAAAFDFTKITSGKTYAGGYADKNVLASYLHIHFAGCPEAAEYFIGKCEQFRERQQWVS